MGVYQIDKLMGEARRLAAEYRRATGKTLAISGEIAISDAITLLGLEGAHRRARDRGPARDVAFGRQQEDRVVPDRSDEQPQQLVRHLSREAARACDDGFELALGKFAGQPARGVVVLRVGVVEARGCQKIQFDLPANWSLPAGATRTVDFGQATAFTALS